MHWHRRLAALLIILALAGCAQGIAGTAPPYAPQSQQNSGNMPEHGVGDGGSM
jgi:hypothetical protein